MDTRHLETFAQDARRKLHEQIAAKLERVLSADTAELRAKAAMIRELQNQIEATSREEVVELVAYTWFNRLCALRYMDVNHYTRMGTVSPRTSSTGEAFTQPEILQEAKQGYVDPSWQGTIEAEAVFGLLDGRLPSDDPQQEAYRLLLVGVCNAYHDVMPFMFEKIDDYTELLMPDDLLSEGSILQAVREALTEANCRDVEVIGWLYQFYISEKKDEVMGRKGKVPSEDIPAVTQLFTPHWIVRYMVENSLGRLWMLNHPESRLVERMDYYISGQLPVDSDQSGTESGQLSVDSDQSNTDHCQLTTDHYLPIDSPEEIRLCDPAAGSGHILTYAFDLLYAIYEEQGYNPIDIPQLILEKNLTGIEIDPRAGALAGFALMMKARAADRRFFRREVQPDICVMEDVSFTPQELDAYMDAVGRDLLTQDVEEWLQQFEQATTFGSLIRPKVTDTGFIRERLDEVGAFQNLFLSKTHENLQHVLEMTEALNPNYHIVVANPPYMGSRNQPRVLRSFLKNRYEKVKSDLFSGFVIRCAELGTHYGHIGVMNPNVWMYLSSYEDLRRFIINRKTLTNLVELPLTGFKGATVQICAYNFVNIQSTDVEGAYIRLVDFKGADQEMAAYTRKAILNPNCSWFYRASAADFKKIPGAPIAYWVSDRIRETFEKGQRLDHYAETRLGMATGNNARYLRMWFEVDLSNIGFNYDSREQARRSAKKWFPYNKGGDFRKWYGNNEYVVNWENDGYVLRNTLHPSGNRIWAHNFNLEYIFRQSITWTFVSSSKFGVRKSPKGFLFDVGGSSAFADKEDINYLTAFLGTKITFDLLKALNPTMNFQAGNLSDLPIIGIGEEGFHSRIDAIFQSMFEYSRVDWDFFETSWNFEILPLLDTAFDISKGPKSSLAQAYLAVRYNWQATTDEMALLERENNRLFIDVYGLKSDIDPNPPLNEITLTCNPHYRYGSNKLKTQNWGNFCERFPETCERLGEISAKMAPDMSEEDRLGLEQKLLDDTMREFVSYAVGCMFGRYSLDKPGLILANQGETLDDYLRKVSGQSSVDSGQWAADSTAEDEKLTTDHRQLTTEISFMPDRDNVIPMLDGDWFADDVAERFKEFLRVTFGEEHYEENLAFIELALNRDIRGYFLRNFYNDHLKRYSKRPIYWLFSSPEGSFNALIYMHRYQPDTVSIVLNDYLREFCTKLTARRRHLEAVERSADATRRDRTQALKGIDKIDKILNELQAYEDEVLYPLAGAQVEIDLDDGVAVNYPKFGKALAHVRGLS